jgi:hypothetical protein
LVIIKYVGFELNLNEELVKITVHSPRKNKQDLH